MVVLTLNHPNVCTQSPQLYLHSTSASAMPPTDPSASRDPSPTANDDDDPAVDSTPTPRSSPAVPHNNSTHRDAVSITSDEDEELVDNATKSVDYKDNPSGMDIKG